MIIHYSNVHWSNLLLSLHSYTVFNMPLQQPLTCGTQFFQPECTCLLYGYVAPNLPNAIFQVFLSLLVNFWYILQFIKTLKSPRRHLRAHSQVLFIPLRGNNVKVNEGMLKAVLEANILLYWNFHRHWDSLVSRYKHKNPLLYCINAMSLSSITQRGNMAVNINFHSGCNQNRQLFFEN